MTQEMSCLNSLYYTAWQLGRPYFSKEIDTACVRFDRSMNAIDYLFNPDFWAPLSDAERVWVFAHEILHAFLQHGHRFKDFPNKDTVNVACDIAIHEYLFDHLGIYKEDIPNIYKMGCFLDTVFKPEDNAAPSESSEYYLNLLVKNGVEVPVNLVVMSDVSEDLSDVVEALIDGMEKYIDEQDAKEINKVLKEAPEAKEAQKPKAPQEKKEGASKMAGDGDGQYTVITITPKAKPRPMPKWKQLIKKVSYRGLDERTVERWAPKARRMHYLQQDFLLPSEGDDEGDNKSKPRLFVFLDTSGSCHQDSERFFKALKSIDLSAFSIRAFAFGEAVSEIDPKSDKLKQFGGTSFHVIEDHIQKIIKQERTTDTKYPDLVFVLTDGWGDEVQPEKPRHWHWFLTEENSYLDNYAPKECRRYLLSDYEFNNA